MTACVRHTCFLTISGCYYVTWPLSCEGTGCSHPATATPFPRITEWRMWRRGRWWWRRWPLGSSGLVLVIRVGVRQRARHVESLQRLQLLVQCTARPSPRAEGAGGGEQAGTVIEGSGQLHAAGMVVRKRVVSSSSCGFPNALDCLCAGHLSSRLKHTHRQACPSCK